MIVIKLQKQFCVSERILKMNQRGLRMQSKDQQIVPYI